MGSCETTKKAPFAVRDQSETDLSFPKCLNHVSVKKKL